MKLLASLVLLFICASVAAQPPPKGTLCMGDWVYNGQQMVSCTAVNQDTGQVFTFTEPGNTSADPPAIVSTVSTSTTRAPEISSAGQIAGLTLCLGVMLLARGRRPRL